mmetsp:Transcript_25426/g.84098  ORF Transcript_25426/g.84098 Transcript_25426/m.84098 type:complete len:210 (+) Transcript_25426:1230-1859(+)
MEREESSSCKLASRTVRFMLSSRPPKSLGNQRLGDMRMLFKALRCDGDAREEEPKLPTGSRRVRRSRGLSEGLVDCAPETFTGEFIGCELPPALLGVPGRSAGIGLPRPGSHLSSSQMRSAPAVRAMSPMGSRESRRRVATTEEQTSVGKGTASLGFSFSRLRVLGRILTGDFLFARGMGMFDAYGELEAPTLFWLALPPSDPPPPVRD